MVRIKARCPTVTLIGYNTDVICGAVYNWVLKDPVLFESPVLDVKGRLSFWNYDLPLNFK